LANGKVSFRVTSVGHFSLDIRDSQGRFVESRGGMGPVEMVSKAEYRHGVYLLTLKNGAGVSHHRIVNP
jgi:hypothetical protein